MSGRMVHFLLVFDHACGELIETAEFHDSRRAVAAYEDMERRYEDRPRVEVVLIGSDSIETVRRTHANYFDGTVAVPDVLAGL